MLVLRVIGVLLLIAVGSCVFAFVLSGNRRYLALAWRITRYALVVAFAILSLLFLERALAPIL